MNDKKDSVMIYDEHRQLVEVSIEDVRNVRAMRIALQRIIDDLKHIDSDEMTVLERSIEKIAIEAMGQNR